ncbi:MULTISPECIES: hypothetical protein [unclassified Microcystis]|jgi:hypothetical protein|uniref:hypothetical protein n=1 Tax=unclassified Microcystis TaxID=2643300 RepID=UPI0022BE3EDC|nr:MULTISPECIES: hypothetical protein [unclassified Microcystis]MCA2692101.1 hypothetical protein [Microcystis sp. M034S2]MCA2749807.1 hypothetical protein [Microcystis sp. M144S2]MCZ8200838.1 hypothetical protein [Microcystis sp. LE19-55.1A]MCZ8308319.1 hypothetical protein [Microcystis sp. LE19-98.1E]
MAGVYKIEISESEAELKELLRKEKTGSGKERIQGWVELSLLSRYYQSAQKAKPNQDCENIPGSCWVSLRQPKLRVLL